MVLSKLEETHNANTPPWIENQQVVIFSQDNLCPPRECERQHVIILRVTTVELYIEIGFDALTISHDALDQLSDRLRRDFQPRPRRDVAKFGKLLSVIENLM